MAPRGFCSVCGKNYALKLASNKPVIRRHGEHGIPAVRSRPCPGAGQPAKPDADASRPA